MIKRLFLTFCLLFFPLLAFGATSTQQFTTDGSWTAPIGVTSVTVAARGAGGGSGGLASNTDNQSSAGGAGGQYAVKVCTVVPGTSYTIDIGAAGTAGANTGGNGGVGADTTFATNVVIAKGGAGGQSWENGFQGGVGSITNGVGDTVRAGGSGGAGGAWNGSGGGGEGGNSDKVGEDGGVGSAGVAGAAGGAGAGGGDGGNGAAGKTNSSGVAGGAGTAPGGGGSGAVVGTSDTNRAGGAGAIGRMDLSWTTPTISALTDNFNDNSIDAAKWTTYTDTGVTLVEANGEIEITTAASSAGTYGILTSAQSYDLTGSQATIKLVDAGSSTIASYNFWFELTVNSLSQGVGWIKNGKYLYCHVPGNSPVELTYSAVDHLYLRIREASGTTYWDYSSDGKNWTNAYSVANPITVTSLVSKLATITDNSEASTTTAKVDDFNILPSAAAGYSGWVTITED